METLKTIMSRHSVRTYTGEPLPEACLEKILLAANAAPSAWAATTKCTSQSAAIKSS